MRVDTDDFARPCSCGKEHHIDVKEIIIEPGAIEKLEVMLDDGMLREYFLPVIICDTNTFEVTEEIMENIYDRCETVILDAEGLQADRRSVEVAIQNIDEEMDLIIAVGTGTIHDICRCIAHEYGVPFVSVPTAASMDGFVSSVATVLWDGFKKTIPSVSPLCVIADIDIISKAPWRLNASGAANIMGNYISLLDWRISQLVSGEYLCERACSMEEQAIRIVKSCIRGIPDGDEDDCEDLMKALILSGLAMQIVGSSRPACGAEHHMSHLWRMEVVNPHLNVYHGEKVGIAALICLQKYKQIAQAIREGDCHVVEYEGMENVLLEHTFQNKNQLQKVIEENTPDPLIGVVPEHLEKCLPQIADMIEDLPDVDDLQRLMEKGGCITDARRIGLTDRMIQETIQVSPYMRNRLTLMRFLKMLEIDRA